jgi:NitT/TauT family transport system substrate-binding protein
MALRRLALAGVISLIAATAVQAADPVRVGALRFISSSALFVAKDKGYFKDEGIDVDLKFFEAAQPIPVAVVSGDLDFGVTTLTGGFLNIAGKGGITIVAGQYAEKKGIQGNTVLVSKKAHDAGFRSVKDFPGHTLALTQVGSSFHYMIARLAEIEGFDLSKVQLKPLQSLPNATNALISGQVDAFIAPIHIARDLVAKGQAVSLGAFSDFAPYQGGVLFTATKLATENRDLVMRFVRAYRRGAAEYNAAFIETGGKGPAADAIAAIIAAYVYPNQPDGPEKAKASALYITPDAAIDMKDLTAQVDFFKQLKLVNASVNPEAFTDLSFLSRTK